MHYYCIMMRIMCKKGSDYTNPELSKYVEHADNFFQLWVKLHGKNGIGNYLHMIGSGHIYVYMKRWGNLNKYSQQGWEALNALIKFFFFRRTNKGGGNSGEDGSKSKLIPIGNLIQRRFFWICNLVPKSLWDYKISEMDEQFSFEEDIIFDNNMIQSV